MKYDYDKLLHALHNKSIWENTECYMAQYMLDIREHSILHVHILHDISRHTSISA